MFRLPRYNAPDFTLPFLKTAKEALFLPAPLDGVAPDNYHATGIFPEYFLCDGTWLLAGESRMDSVAVLKEGVIHIVEKRRLKQGDMVAVGRTEDGSQGIYVNTQPFAEDKKQGDAFAFRQGRTRETAYSKDYDELYELLKHEKENGGSIVWVLGPACTFDSDCRSAMADIVKAGYVQGLLAGNALATHDLEAAMFRTALGQDIYTQESRHNGHYNHIDTINAARKYSTIKAFVEGEGIGDGIMHACVTNGVPFVLAGSIRDDGPLPEVIGDVYQAQNVMRDIIKNATTIICMASVLHSVAAGNMTPCFRLQEDRIRPVYFYSVDISEFAVGKLSDRGSLSAKSIVTNVQDFLVNVKKGLGI